MNGTLLHVEDDAFTSVAFELVVRWYFWQFPGHKLVIFLTFRQSRWD